MRCSLKAFLLNSCLVVAGFGAVSTAAHAAQPGAEDSGFVGNLAAVRDLEPLRIAP